jgi:hypothetical protein
VGEAEKADMKERLIAGEEEQSQGLALDASSSESE